MVQRLIVNEIWQISFNKKGREKMKKILSVMVLLFVVIAFSGLGTAAPVSAYSIKDVGSKTVTNGNVQTYFHWYCKYFRRTRLKFYFSSQLQNLHHEIYYDDEGNYITKGGYGIRLIQNNLSFMTIKTDM